MTTSCWLIHSSVTPSWTASWRCQKGSASLWASIPERRLRATAAAAARAGRSVRVLVEIDLGMRRVGLETPEEAVRLAELVQELGRRDVRGPDVLPGAHPRAPAKSSRRDYGPWLETSRASWRRLQRAGLPTGRGEWWVDAHHLEGVTRSLA